MGKPAALILGTGTLSPAVDNVRRGVAEFPVRGQREIVMLRPSYGDDGIPRALFRCGRDEGHLRFAGGVFRGEVRIEGYLMVVEMAPQTGDVMFYD